MLRCARRIVWRRFHRCHTAAQIQAHRVGCRRRVQRRQHALRGGRDSRRDAPQAAAEVGAGYAGGGRRVLVAVRACRGGFFFTFMPMSRCRLRYSSPRRP